MTDIFDYAFIGCGVATVFALQRIAEKATNKKAVIIDIGRPPMKRKHQMTGWAGASIGSDGKLFTKSPDLESLITTPVYEKYSENVVSFLKDKNVIKDLVKSNLPESFLTKVKDYNISQFDYYQMVPKNIHSLSKIISNQVIDDKRFEFNFDEEVIDIVKENDLYKITTQPTIPGKSQNDCEYYAKSIVIATGRTSPLFNYELLKAFDKIESNSKLQYGIKVEVDDDIIGDLNKSIFTLSKNNISFGRFIWNGTMIPEDRFEYVISATRTNESRWETKKVHFDILCNLSHENASEELDRIANLSFIMANERVIKESVKSIVNGKSKISILKEYGTSKNNWLIDAINDLEKLFPGVIANAKCYYPTLISAGTYTPKIDSKMSLGDDIYLIGEAAGVYGIFAAAVMGNYFGDKIY
jgi:uncharacterized FAD-dependent dehydrogenase